MAPPSPRQSLSLSKQVLDYVRDPAVALWRKASGLFAAVYVVWPIDLIPDFPLIGWLDDLGVASAVAWFLLRDIKKHAKRLQAGPPTPPGPPQP